MANLSRWIFLLSLVLSLSGISLSLEAATSEAVNVFNVRDFGAAGDGKTLDSPAINKTIEAAGAVGGGTVLFPAGTYLSGSIHLQSNIHLLIDIGAMVLGAPQEMNAYDETEPFPNNPYQDGGHCFFHNSLIWGENLQNVSITGHGWINGGGLVRDDDILDRLCGNAFWGKKIDTSVSVPADLGPVRLGNKSIALKLCRNVTIRDVTMVHGGHFCVLVTGCNNLTLDNVTIDTNRDGIDIDCCQNTTVSNCRVNSPHDDAICPKSTFALGRNVLTENLTIGNCQVSGYVEGTLLDGTMKKADRPSNGRIKFGTESSGGFRNCTVSNCTFRSCEGLALEEVDGGIMEDIICSNLTMVDVDKYAIYVTTGSRNRGGNVQGDSLCRNILITNVTADNVNKDNGIQITGLPGHPIEDIRLDNIRLISRGGGSADDATKPARKLGKGYPEPGKVPVYGIYASHVRNLELANINTRFLQPDFRPAALFSDIDGLEIDNFKPQVAPGVDPVIVSSDVGKPVVRNSPLIHL